MHRFTKALKFVEIEPLVSAVIRIFDSRERPRIEVRLQDHVERWNLYLEVREAWALYAKDHASWFPFDTGIVVQTYIAWGKMGAEKRAKFREDHGFLPVRGRHEVREPEAESSDELEVEDGHSS